MRKHIIFACICFLLSGCLWSSGLFIGLDNLASVDTPQKFILKRMENNEVFENFNVKRENKGFYFKSDGKNDQKIKEGFAALLNFSSDYYILIVGEKGKSFEYLLAKIEGKTLKLWAYGTDLETTARKYIDRMNKNTITENERRVVTLLLPYIKNLVNGGPIPEVNSFNQLKAYTEAWLLMPESKVELDNNAYYFLMD